MPVTIKTTRKTSWTQGSGLPLLEIPAGTKAAVLTQKNYWKLPVEDRIFYKNLKRKYTEKGKKGLFARLEGEIRWLDSDSYEIIY